MRFISFGSVSLPVLLLLAHVALAAVPPPAPEDIDSDIARWMADDNAAPVDYGLGPGVKPAGLWHAHTASHPPVAAEAASQGVFGAPVPWPIDAIHMGLLPDGRVMSFGTDEAGLHSNTILYDIWTPGLGTGTNAHMVLPVTTPADFFCSNATLLAGSGEMLVADGALPYGKAHSKSQPYSNFFNPATNGLTQGQNTNDPRWYPSLVARGDGSVAILGGRLSGKHPALTPEIFSPSTGQWSLLPGAASDAAFGNQAANWFYPRGFTAPDGALFLLANNAMYSLQTTGAGSITAYPKRPPIGRVNLPSVVVAPGILLSLRLGGGAILVNVNGATPSITATPPLSQLRYWSNTTLMADGRVLVNGGSSVANELRGIAYQAEIYDPVANDFAPAATNVIPRLYHSTALLLPDGTLLTAGGGAPGPVTELNAEIYYPPYLFNPDGSTAARPSLSGAPATAAASQAISATVGPSDSISRLTLLRFGAVTHAWDEDQRFFDLPFTQSGTSLSATLPSNVNVLLSGYYMLFALNAAGVPSVAQIIRVLND